MQEQRATGEARCRGLFFWLCKVWRVVTRRPKTGDPCLRVPGRLIHRPDPCIYSQFFLMQLGLPVTWDNPDVRIFRNGVEQDSYSLTADTEYRLDVTARNSSRDKPAPGTQVKMRWIEFGVGGQVRHPITSVPADVPVWPGTSLVQATWRTPATPGHYCIEVELAHPDDGLTANNRGWNNTVVRAASSPMEFPIRIFNMHPQGCPPVREGGDRHVRPHRIFAGWAVLGAVAGGFASGIGNESVTQLRVATYAAAGYGVLFALGFMAEWLGSRSASRRFAHQGEERHRVPCNLVEASVDSYSFADDTGKAFDPKQRFAETGPASPARVDPSPFMFADGELFRDVLLMVDAPDEPGPAAVFNVNIRQGGSPAGGVTVTVTRGG
jgi:hypothetical protein